MSEPEMYPLVDNTTYKETFETFADLRESFEALHVGLNFPLSWYLYDEQNEDWDGEEPRAFHFCIVLPRKTSTTVWSTHEFEHNEVQAWLDTYVKASVMEWYGWSE